MSVNFYQSTDSGAPVLNGTVGSLVSVLDACLVNGYGSGSNLKNPAGWTIAYTATNERVYTMGANGTGCSFFVNDNSPEGSPQEATVTGFKSVTGLGTGLQQFPISSQFAVGCPWHKSVTADTVARPWYLFADQNTCRIVIQTGLTTLAGGYIMNEAFEMGDIAALSSSDGWASIIIGNAGYQASWNNNPGATSRYGSMGGSSQEADTAHIMCADSNGLTNSPLFGKVSELSPFMNTTVDSQNNAAVPNGSGYNYSNPLVCPYPNAADGGLILFPVRVFQGNTLRGNLKGVWVTPHHRPMNNGDTFTATSGAYAGKSFIALNLPFYCNAVGGGIGPGMWFFETSNTWPATYPTS